jgi:hypothetical protein
MLLLLLQLLWLLLLQLLLMINGRRRPRKPGARLVRGWVVEVLLMAVHRLSRLLLVLITAACEV